MFLIEIVNVLTVWKITENNAIYYYFFNCAELLVNFFSYFTNPIYINKMLLNTYKRQNKNKEFRLISCCKTLF